MRLRGVPGRRAVGLRDEVSAIDADHVLRPVEPQTPATAARRGEGTETSPRKRIVPRMRDPSLEPRLAVVVDDRESRSGIADTLAALGRQAVVARLAVGDFAVGGRVIGERKTVADLVASILDRRIFDQAYELRGACARPLVIVEGTDAAAAARLPPALMRAVLASLLVGYGLPVLRTTDVSDTAAWIDDIARREERRIARRAAAARRSAVTRTTLDLLAAIPGVGAARAQALATAIGPPATVLTADTRALREVPGVGRVTAARIQAAATGSAARASGSAAP
jgi:ERCC4-type nuclease